jgi:hypothetical protein
VWHLYFTFRGKHQLRVYKKRVLRNIFGPMGEAVTGDYRKLHNEKPHNLYSSSNITGVMKSKRMQGWVFGMYGGEQKYIQGLEEEI